MVSAGRVCWTAIPFILTFASLICFVLVFVGNTSGATNSLYFTAFNATDFVYKSSLNTSDWYTVGLWNYCSGSAINTFNNPTHCSPRKAFYHFDPVATLQLNATSSEINELGTGTNYTSIDSDAWNVALAAYADASLPMWILYIAAIGAATVTFLLGFAGCSSRCGSVFTTVAAGITALIACVASAEATAVFIILSRTIDEKLKTDGITSTGLGRNMFVATWLGTGFAVLAAFSWIFTICCCAGDHHKKSHGHREEMQYQRVPSPSV